jgi:hypothetical protein
MRLVVADSSPLNYLVWIEQVEILPALFERIFVPEVVQNELRHSEAPESVRRWIAAPPSWLEIVPEEHESGGQCADECAGSWQQRQQDYPWQSTQRSRRDRRPLFHGR